MLIFSTILVALFSFSISSNADSIKEKDEIVDQAKELIESYGFVVEEDADMLPDRLLEFDTLEEFESFLISEQQDRIVEMDVDNSSIRPFDDGPYTLTYKAVDNHIVGKITGYARVTRSSGKKIMKVILWSQQTGVSGPITWTENASWYTTHNSNKNGKATIKGTKYYGIAIAGLPVGYRHAVTLTIPF